MAAAAAAPQLGADDGDHLDALLAQERVAVGVAVVGDHHARSQGNVVVAAVPLLALRGIGVAAGLDDAQLLEVERLGDDVDERLGLAGDLDAGRVVARPQRDRVQAINDIRERR